MTHCSRNIGPWAEPIKLPEDISCNLPLFLTFPLRLSCIDCWNGSPNPKVWFSVWLGRFPFLTGWVTHSSVWLTQTLHDPTIPPQLQKWKMVSLRRTDDLLSLFPSVTTTWLHPQYKAYTLPRLRHISITNKNHGMVGQPEFACQPLHDGKVTILFLHECLSIIFHSNFNWDFEN